MDLVTGRLAGATPSANDVDGGTTSVRSPAFDLPAGGSYSIRLRYYFAHNSASDSRDSLRVELVRQDGARLTLLQELGAPTADTPLWATANVAVPAAFVGSTVRMLISATDGGNDNVVEAAVDDVSVIKTN
jgi:hypothetical protein